MPSGPPEGQEHSDPLRGLISHSFQDDLESFMCSRMDKLNPRTASSKFAEADEMAGQLLELLGSHLPEEARDKFDEYADLQSLRDTLLTELFYRHGLADGVMLIVRVLAGARITSLD